VVKRPLTNI
jgi:hypothetical protein